MTSDSFKASQRMVACPRTVLSIAVMVGGLAMFLVLGSVYLVSQPIFGPVIRGYVYSFDLSRRLDTVTWSNNTVTDSLGSNLEDAIELDTSVTTEGVKIAETPLQSKSAVFTETGLNESETNPVSSYEKTGAVPTSAPVLGHISHTAPADSVIQGCDLYNGTWIYDSSGPLYTNDSCPVLSSKQNCQGNGRPDKEYENWRWKPAECDLPRFDAKKFLELMRGKTLAFVGDSVARNQMESLICILWQVEVPKWRGNRRMQRFYFRSTSTTIIRIWSAWLVHKTLEAFDYVPEGVVKLHLDVPDEEDFMDFLPTFDVLVISSGHWFTKQSVYILNNEIVGQQLWWPTDNSPRPTKMNNVEAFGISVETILTAIATHPNYTGLTIVRTYSPDHYEKGGWNTGGSCTGKVRPALDGELVENDYNKMMYEKQVTGFKSAIKKKTNKSNFILMDITKAFTYRHDGHPGPYKSNDPNKITQRGPDGRPPPQDCLHWCMPGPPDTWNEIVLQIITREFESTQT